jgi:hypothetical protein
MKSPNARVASREATVSFDSHPDSDDTQAPLLREVDQNEARLNNANKELKDADNVSSGSQCESSLSDKTACCQ